MIKGYLAVINGECKKNMDGIFTYFIPTTNREKAENCVAGNGILLSMMPYEVALDDLSAKEKETILKRMAALQ